MYSVCLPVYLTFDTVSLLVAVVGQYLDSHSNTMLTAARNMVQNPFSWVRLGCGAESREFFQVAVSSSSGSSRGQSVEGELCWF